MALYSWFSKSNNEPSKKIVRANNNLFKSADSSRYIESYTLWPTAKIKQDIEVKVTAEVKLANKVKTSLTDKPMSLAVALNGNK